MIHQIIEALKELPPHWRLVPVNGNKQPMGQQWQHHPQSTKELITQLTDFGSVLVRGTKGPYRVIPFGVGLLTGQTDNEYLIAVDCDGEDAYHYLNSRGYAMPKTVAWTSGRPHRAQYLYRILGHWPFSSRRLGSLELRGAGAQSVLPPSPHPMTGQYRWLSDCHPKFQEVAIAPDWVKVLLQSSTKEKVQKKKYKTLQPQNTDRIPNPNCNISYAVASFLVEIIHPKFASEYDSWLRIGMALHSIDESFFELWNNWSRRSHKYKPGECAYLWKLFEPNKGITYKTLLYYVYQ